MKRRKISFKIKVWIIIMLIGIIINVFIYAFDKIVASRVLDVANVEMKRKAIETLNQSIMNKYLESFQYDDIIKIEKDNSGNITLVKSDTLKLNKLACDVALESQQKLKDMGDVGMKIPIGYITQNNVIAYFGPSITVKMNPIGYIETKYISDFESVGFNQTRHKIYIQVKSNIRVIIPTKSEDVQILSEIPVCETIIVGKIPENFLGGSLENSGFRIRGN
ncbi:sporulation protein [Clostridium sp. HMP27]|nr:sporulation protein [Clostridium sp. HMP27]